MFPSPPYVQSYPGYPNKDHLQSYMHSMCPNYPVASPMPNGTFIAPPPFSGNSIYPSPSVCNGCCTHGHPSGYFPRPLIQYAPYPHTYPSYYPPYFVPPFFHDPNQSVNHGSSHCCGCPNHVSNKKETTRSKIHDGSSEDGKNNPTLPFFPQPFAWLPPDGGRCWRMDDEGKARGLIHGREESEKDKGKSDASPWQLPIIWIPEKDVKEVVPSAKIEEEPPSKIKIVPVKNPMEDSDAAPVKQLKPPSDSQSAASEKQAEGTSNAQTSVLLKRDETKPSSANSKAKSSKLPPVCLRVDPLPRKRNGNGSQKSQDPPKKENADDDKKAKPADRGVAELDARDNLGNNERNLIEVVDESDKLRAKRKEVKVIKVLDDNKGHNIPVEVAKGNSSEKEIPIHFDPSDIRMPEATKTIGEGMRDAMDAKNNRPGDSEALSRNLSEKDAAIRIQSCYRGFQVRRWEPLKKLKEIRRIHERAFNVREKINALETPSRKSPNDKEGVVIGETIMNLLLQLDTIQGLHPSVRAMRKSVSQELICLQERLDTLTNQKIQDESSTQEEPLVTDAQIKAGSDDLATASSDQSNEEHENVASYGEMEMMDQQQQPCFTAQCSPREDEVITSSDIENFHNGNEINFHSEEMQEKNDLEESSVALPSHADQMHDSPDRRMVESLNSCEGPAETEPRQTDHCELSQCAIDTSLEIHIDEEHQDLQANAKQHQEEDSSNTENLKSQEIRSERDDEDCFDHVDGTENQLSNGEKMTAPLPRDKEVNAGGDYHQIEEDSLEVAVIDCLAKTAILDTMSGEMEIFNKFEETNVGDEALYAEEKVMPDVERVEHHSNQLKPMEEISYTEGKGKDDAQGMLNDDEKRLVEQNLVLKKMLQELQDAGKGQMEVISSLNGRVKHLERKLAHRRRLKLRRNRSMAKSSTSVIAVA